MSENHFAKALHNFTMSAAAGDAIKHLTDKGFTLTQIKEQLTFPAPVEYIAEVMWDRLVETNKILDAAGVSAVMPQSEFRRSEATRTVRATGALSDRTRAVATEIIEHYDEYGRKSFLQVQKESPEEEFSPEDYVQYENLLVLKHAQEQVSSLSGHIPLKVRSTGSHRDM